ncbi:MAG: hypothetical protein WAJ87_05995 [Bryobacteraceae bacterium]
MGRTERAESSNLQRDRFPQRDNGNMSDAQPATAEFYCPNCAQPVPEPLLCGDCGALLCRTCGKPVERIDELGIG